MMRTAFWILLAGNLVFFAVMHWGRGLTVDPAAQMQPELNADKVRLLGSQRAEGGASSAPLSVNVASQPVVSVASQPVGKGARICMEWGEFSGGDLARATSALEELHLGDRLVRREVEHTIGYWVFIPPLRDKASVLRKIDQLKARGVEEYFVVQEAGSTQNAISLGIFRTREAAEHYLSELRKRDVRSAQVGERSGKLKATVLVLNELDASLSGKLEEMHQRFPGSDLQEISCVH